MRDHHGAPPAGMSAAATSVMAFGAYMGVQGLWLLLSPDSLLALLGLPPSADVWPRVCGIALLVLGGYYAAAARAGLEPFFRFTLVGRTFQWVCFAGLVIAGLAPPPLLATSTLEFASALWTLAALRRRPL